MRAVLIRLETMSSVLGNLVAWLRDLVLPKLPYNCSNMFQIRFIPTGIPSRRRQTRSRFPVR